MPELRYTEDGTPYLGEAVNHDPFNQTNELSPLVNERAAARIRRSVLHPVAPDAPLSAPERDLLRLAKTIKGAVTMFGDAASGAFNVTPEVPGQLSENDLAKAQANDANAFERTNDLAGIVMGGGMPVAALGAGGTLGMAGSLKPALKIGDKIYSGKIGDLHADVFDKYASKGLEDGPLKEGFVDASGKWYSRSAATRYASKNKLLDEGAYASEPLDAIDLNTTKFRSGGNEDAPGPVLLNNQQPAPVWHSAVENAVHSSPQELGSPEQWMGFIKNAKGVKPEELHWLGLEDWLMQQKHPVSRKQIQDYIESHKVEVKDALNTNKKESDDFQIDAEVVMDRWQNWDQYSARRGNLNGLPTVEVKREGAHHSLYIDGDKAGSFGSQDAANKHAAEFTKAWEKKDMDRLQDFAWDIESSSVPEGGAGRYQEYQLPGGTNYNELLLTLPENRPSWDNAKGARLRYLEAQKERGEPFSALDKSDYDQLSEIAQKRDSAPEPYQSGHWDEPNVLAHVRFNDRTINGKKTLFIEELQSDLHQQGRDRGYAGNHKPEDTSKWEAKPIPPEEVAAHRNRTPELTNQEWLKERNPDNLPMWNLSNPHPSGDGTRYPMGWWPGRTAEEALKNASENYNKKLTVPDAPFKKNWHELAMKRITRYAAENGYDAIAWTPGQVQAERWRGSSEHGHGKFYDEIMVNSANKLGKPHGMKVDKADLHTGGPDEGHYIEKVTQDKWAIFSDKDDTVIRGGFKSEAEAQKWVETNYRIPVHYMELTPQMRDTAMRKGFPMFVGGVPVMPVDHNPFEEKR